MTRQVNSGANLQAPQTFSGLDGLRGVAAILVTLVHIRSEMLGYSGYPAGDGYLAVDLFYALSGFVLINAYQTRFEIGMSVAEFMRIRIIRLYPMYLAGLLLGVAVKLNSLMAAASLNDYLQLGWAFLFNLCILPSPSFVSEQLFTLNPVAWSLFFEVVLNLLLVLFWRRLTPKTLVFILVSSAVMVAAAAVHWGKLNFGGSWHDILFGLARAVFSFAVGIALFGLYKANRLPKLAGQWPLGVCLVGMITYLTLPVPAGVRAMYDLFFLFVFSPVLVVAAISSDVSIQAKKIYGLLGAASYPLYAVHYPLLQGISDFFKSWLAGDLGSYELVIGLCVTAAFLVIGCFLDRYVDRPARAWLSGRRFSTQQTLIA